MKFAILILIAAFVILPTGGISAAEPPSNPSFQQLDKMAEPVGGLSAIMQLVSYPKSAKKDGIEGRVLLSMVVDTAGCVKNLEVKEGVRSDLDEAAVKALEESKWIPAQKDGRPVESSIIVPIQFRLESKTRE
jgi:TonB family protein